MHCSHCDFRVDNRRIQKLKKKIDAGGRNDARGDDD